MTHRIARVGMLALALLAAALVGACEVFYIVAGKPVDCELAVDTIRVELGPDTGDTTVTGTIGDLRCEEDGDAR